MQLLKYIKLNRMKYTSKMKISTNINYLNQTKTCFVYNKNYCIE